MRAKQHGRVKEPHRGLKMPRISTHGICRLRLNSLIAQPEIEAQALCDSRPRGCAASTVLLLRLTLCSLAWMSFADDRGREEQGNVFSFSPSEMVAEELSAAVRVTVPTLDWMTAVEWSVMPNRAWLERHTTPCYRDLSKRDLCGVRSARVTIVTAPQVEPKNDICSLAQPWPSQPTRSRMPTNAHLRYPTYPSLVSNSAPLCQSYSASSTHTLVSLALLLSRSSTNICFDRPGEAQNKRPPNLQIQTTHRANLLLFFFLTSSNVISSSKGAKISDI
jgi:hypothetical protein